MDTRKIDHTMTNLEVPNPHYLTAGALKKALEDIPDDMPVLFKYDSREIWGAQAKAGDRVVTLARMDDE